MIKEINQVISYEQQQFIPALIEATQEMQKKGFVVEIQYSFSNGIYTAVLIGRKEEKKNASSKSL